MQCYQPPLRRPVAGKFKTFSHFLSRSRISLIEMRRTVCNVILLPLQIFCFMPDLITYTLQIKKYFSKMQ